MEFIDNLQLRFACAKIINLILFYGILQKHRLFVSLYYLSELDAYIGYVNRILCITYLVLVTLLCLYTFRSYSCRQFHIKFCYIHIHLHNINVI